MEKIVCGKCGKVIEGYTNKHVTTLLEQHYIKHRNEGEYTEGDETDGS